VVTTDTPIRKNVMFEGEILNAVAELAEQEHRSFTNMVEVLVLTGLTHRTSSLNPSVASSAADPSPEEKP